MDDLKKRKLEDILGKGRIEENKNLSPYLTLHNNAVAQLYFEAESRDDLINISKLKAQNLTPVLIIGGGSNIVFTKGKIEGLIVKNAYRKKEILKDAGDYVDFLVSSGYIVTQLVSEIVKKGLGGLEYHLGLPGTVGGAIYMNSKWTKPVQYVGDSVMSAFLVDKKGEVKEVDKSYFNFAYDYSILQKTKESILEVVFRFKKESPELLKKRSQDALEYRKATQPFGVATCGCFFRNIKEETKNRLNLPTTSAGYLIDKAGLKNLEVGDFMVSDKHANFIINKGTGKTKDLIKLLSIIKETVKDKYGVELEEEVVIVY